MSDLQAIEGLSVLRRCTRGNTWLSSKSWSGRWNHSHYSSGTGRRLADPYAQKVHSPNLLKVGTHEGTYCRRRISCAVHTKGHVAGIGFLKGVWELNDVFWLVYFSEVTRRHAAWTVHTRRPCKFRCFVAATCLLNSNWSEFRGHVARTKLRTRNKIFHENWAFTRSPNFPCSPTRNITSHSMKN